MSPSILVQGPGGPGRTGRHSHRRARTAEVRSTSTMGATSGACPAPSGRAASTALLISLPSSGVPSACCSYLDPHPNPHQTCLFPVLGSSISPLGLNGPNLGMGPSLGALSRISRTSTTGVCGLHRVITFHTAWLPHILTPHPPLLTSSSLSFHRSLARVLGAGVQERVAAPQKVRRLWLGSSRAAQSRETGGAGGRMDKTGKTSKDTTKTPTPTMQTCEGMDASMDPCRLIALCVCLGVAFTSLVANAARIHMASTGSCTRPA